MRKFHHNYNLGETIPTSRGISPITPRDQIGSPGDDQFNAVKDATYFGFKGYDVLNFNDLSMSNLKFKERSDGGHDIFTYNYGHITIYDVEGVWTNIDRQFLPKEYFFVEEKFIGGTNRDDVLWVDGVRSHLSGRNGNDLLVVDGAGSNVLDGGVGYDIAVFFDRNNPNPSLNDLTVVGKPGEAISVAGDHGNSSLIDVEAVAVVGVNNGNLVIDMASVDHMLTV